MVNSLIKKWLVLLFLVGKTAIVSSQSVEPIVYIKGGFHTIIVSIWDKNHTCIIEQYNNVGTSLKLEYHKDKFTYKQIDGHLVLTNRNSKAPSDLHKHPTESYYSLCFYPITQLYKEEDGRTIFPTLQQRYGVVANEDGYFYEFPLECRGDMLFSDSCMVLRFGEKNGIVLSRRSIDEESMHQATPKDGSLTDLMGWSALWNNRLRLSETIGKDYNIVGRTFKCQEDSIYFGKRRSGVRYLSSLQQNVKFKYSVHDPYITIRSGYSTDTLLYNDGVLYEAQVIQYADYASKKIITGPLGFQQEPTGNMRINIYIESSIRTIDTVSIISSVQKYFFPINFHWK